MEQPALDRLLVRSMELDCLNGSIAYLTEHLRQFLRPGERVLICFHHHEYGNISWLMERAVLACSAVPVLWGEDIRWKSLLRMAFSSRASCVIGPPLVVLGLAKTARANATPLFVRNVVTAGYLCLDWMIEGIRSGFDCRSWGCFSIGLTGIVCGFSCGNSLGVHLRDEVYGVDIVDEGGNLLPEGQTGEVILYCRDDPASRCSLGDRGRLEREPCACGCLSPRVMQLGPGKAYDPDLLELGQHLQSWTSILDCRLCKGPYGLEMELVTFPGEKLPKLPTAAKLIVRPWNPDADEPFWYFPLSKNTENFPESH